MGGSKLSPNLGFRGLGPPDGPASRLALTDALV